MKFFKAFTHVSSQVNASVLIHLDAPADILRKTNRTEILRTHITISTVRTDVVRAPGCGRVAKLFCWLAGEVRRDKMLRDPEMTVGNIFFAGYGRRASVTVGSIFYIFAARVNVKFQSIIVGFVYVISIDLDLGIYSPPPCVDPNNAYDILVVGDTDVGGSSATDWLVYCLCADATRINLTAVYLV
ncbi:predicted protein [Plenodomus lingam JN3]|uniref:Predicted protein n=1 Tax=Leptosphaeria maculans (strain JN3 / isolate v23.1.3 / race Av1-4-5-6-7-8) TaxID=985895 RepID=E5AAD9_LEPMJ|nr:predicted protein [Plenodomus lingam JN3]CBY00630.1 predicted protein [Plenodomus lingam JN3]